MDRKATNNYIKFLREIINDGGIDATDEQLKYLTELFLDEHYVVGIHNTSLSYQSFLDNGLYNYDSRDEESTSLSNTVMYSSTLLSLVMYPNGDGVKRKSTAIVLKIPKKVFSKEQGIFETLPDGNYGIPPQFIVGAFYDGDIINNPKYQKDYNNQDAIKCDDIIHENIDRKSQVKIFNREYKKNKNQKVGLVNRLKSLINRVKNNGNVKVLPSADKQEAIQYNESKRDSFVESLMVDVSGSVGNTQDNNERDEQENDEYNR